MKIISKIGLFLVLSILITGIVSAENTTDIKTASEYAWNGTWSSPQYTLYISQDESGISGAYVPMDLLEYDSGYLEGTLSSDGKTYSGIWIESGKSTNTFSNDRMSFTINGSTDPRGPMTEPFHYTTNATRIGEIVDPENPWTGNYVSEWKTYNITQDGHVVTGINEPLADIDDNSGVMNGTISEDGMSYTGTWIEKGGYTFVMAEDGLSINATISKSLESDAVVEQMTFSK
jgi:hypothetical protein